ncbi:MAG: fructose-bisphosphatase class II, partial [Rickettsiales bacterium]|nr:fructose-bisphosphatase class II [Rickettsiales bacterium]
SGVTDGYMLDGVKKGHNKITTHTLLMDLTLRKVTTTKTNYLI